MSMASPLHDQTSIPELKRLKAFNAQLQQLTPRESDVLRLLCEGKSNREAATALGLSVRTVETYRRRIILKFSEKSLVRMAGSVAQIELMDVLRREGWIEVFDEGVRN